MLNTIVMSMSIITNNKQYEEVLGAKELWGKSEPPQDFSIGASHQGRP
jgi:hypothetical protein